MESPSHSTKSEEDKCVLSVVHDTAFSRYKPPTLSQEIDCAFLERQNSIPKTPTRASSSFTRCSSIKEDPEFVSVSTEIIEEEKVPQKSPKSPSKRKERFRRNMKQTLQLGLMKKSMSRVEGENWGFSLPSKIANSINIRVIEATMEGFADIENSFEGKYDVLEIIGEGTTGLVKKCVNKETKETRAVKIIRTNEIEILKAVKSEFLMQKELDHPHIVKVYEMYYNPITSRIQIIMEMIEGNELFESICNNGPFTEAAAKIIFREILQAIEYMHYKGVCHRDLKPHNILLTSSEKHVKVTDFNVSKYFRNTLSEHKELIKMTTHTGTMAFSAPETFTQEEYSEKVDSWSAGAVLYTMLAGYQPFNSDHAGSLIHTITHGIYDLEEKDPWPKISSDAKDLIRKLMEVDPTKRLSAKTALHHPWISWGKSMSVKVDQKNEESIMDTNETLHSGAKNPELNRYSTATIKERRLYRLALEASFQRLNLQ